ncbi:MAG: helix-hairpin-helix domain-containing protein [Amoebophilaceae bacterium]|nr:helix-hairpin-helix domain-containing protein [Amoebophilaceae bacterium]
MMWHKLRHKIKRCFYFSNTECNGLLAIIILILVFIMAPQTFKLYYSLSANPLSHVADSALLAKNLALLEAHANKFTPVAINTASAEQLEELLCISPPIAKRIISYRNKLGGFVTVDQYDAVYGLSNPLRFRLKQQTFIPANYLPKQISLNHATFKELVSHIYMTAIMAKAIIAYRRKAKFVTIMDIEKLPGYDSDWGRKMKPYLSL